MFTGGNVGASAMGGDLYSDFSGGAHAKSGSKDLGNKKTSGSIIDTLKKKISGVGMQHANGQ